MKFVKIIISVISLVLMASCSYDGYVEDYDFSGTYFGSQQPLRTIVAEGDRSFEIGVTVGGLRVDDGSHWVDYVIDTVLLDSLPEATGFTLLPDNYYTIGDASRFNITKTFLRTVEVKLTDAFFEDPLALTTNYALPLRIVDTSLDSIMGFGMDETTAVASPEQENKDITIVVIKYVSPYSGTYYSKGVQYTLDAAGGTPTDTLTYSIDELLLNDEIDLTSLGVDSVETSRIGGNISGGLKLDLSTGSLVVSSDDVTSLQVDLATHVDGTFTLNYSFEKLGIYYRVEEELIQRQSPALDLRFEEW